MPNTMTNPKPQQGNKKADDHMRWAKMQTFLNILLKNHPIMNSVINAIKFNIEKKQIEKKQNDQNPLTAEEKNRIAFEQLALANPAARQAISQTVKALDLATRRKTTVALQSRATALRDAYNIDKTAVDKTLFFGFNKQASTGLSSLAKGPGNEIAMPHAASIAEKEKLALALP